MSSEIPNKHLNPLYVMQKLESVLSDDVILVADGGDFVATAAYTLRLVLGAKRTPIRGYHLQARSSA